tara:strand:+ start:81 stop:527 length:447 start_codon:yes stop_codon:yes gene_type:complete
MIKCSGAGIVVYYDNRDKNIEDLESDILYLTLVDNEGLYDFPKGGIDEGEYSFDCALRETDEEINLKYEDFSKFLCKESNEGFQCGRGLIMFVGEIKKDSIYNTKRKRNEKTGNLEHIDDMWLNKNSCMENLPEYLKPCLEWASKKIV